MTKMERKRAYWYHLVIFDLAGLALLLGLGQMLRLIDKVGVVHPTHLVGVVFEVGAKKGWDLDSYTSSSSLIIYIIYFQL